MARRKPPDPRSGDAAANALQAAFGLTPREAEILILITYGKTNGEIAEILAISPKTVSTHVRTILLKLGAERRTGAAAQALQILHDDGKRT
jgi:DNA-binding CsgD family transcriptional regulator